MLAQLLLRCGVLLPFMPPVMNLPPEVSSQTCMESSSAAAVPCGESEPSACPAPCPVADEIAQLHHALQMSPLAGSSLEPAPVDAEAENGQPSPSTTAEFQQVLSDLLQNSSDEPRPVQSQSAGGLLPSDADASLSAFLRTISRHMDQLANDLEERREYTTADELRGLSQQLRHRTRRID